MSNYNPRKALTALVNTIKDKDTTLWQIFLNIESILKDDDSKLAVLTGETSYELSVFCKTPTAANDIADFWYTINLPVFSSAGIIYKSLKLVKVIIDAKTVPSGGAAVFDLKYSRDNGVTFVSLFQGISFKLPTGLNTTNYKNMTVTTLFEGDIIRLDCSAVHSVAGVEIKLLGVPQ